MSNKEENNPEKPEDDINFERELDKLKLSAERGIPFSERKKEVPRDSETEEEFLARMKEMEKAMRNPDEREIKEVLGFPNFPKGEDLTDKEISAALELATTALENKNIVLDVIYPTPERELYRFITEEVLKKEAGMAGAGGMTMHIIYEEYYPNHSEDIKVDITDVLHFICRGYKGSMPWRIAHEVSLYGEKVTEEDFIAVITDHRNIFEGMSFIGIDSIKVDIKGSKAHAKAKFRFYLDHSSGTPGEVSADATFDFEHHDGEDIYLLNHMVIDHFGIK